MNDKVVPFRPAPAAGLSDNLMRLLADPNISAEKLQIVLAMQKELSADMRREAFNAAFAEMAPHLPKIDKRGFVELIKNERKIGQYSYAKYEDLDDAIRPILHTHGFSLTFYPGAEDGKPVLYGELLHTSGGSKRGFRFLTPDRGPGRNDLQAEGSSLSYQRRYLAEQLLNLVRKGVDDDGIAGGTLPITQKQADDLRGLLKATGVKEDTFLRMFVTDAQTVEAIPERDYARLKNALEEKKRSVSNGQSKRGNPPNPDAGADKKTPDK